MFSEDLTYKLLTGEIVKNDYGTFYFSEPGNWIDSDSYAIIEKLHREDGPAAEYANGSKYWRIYGKRHREDGPAVEAFNGFKEWWINGERHREDGPAVEQPDGSKYWWLNGKLLTEEEFTQQMKSK